MIPPQMIHVGHAFKFARKVDCKWAFKITTGMRPEVAFAERVRADLLANTGK